ncbi:MAG TPA: YdcF family protein [Pseudonocardiaceae bacterium]|nr:YdcF family protein [Pseudonocardiaceae bacterium]
MGAAGFWLAIRRWTLRAVLGLVVVAILVVGGTAFRIWQFGRVDDRNHADVILVLGAAQYDGDPSSVLQARLNQAMDLYDEGVAGQIVTVGGRQPKDRFTEAEAGDRYLTDRGIPAGRVIEVNSGNDTLTSLRAASAMMAGHGWHSAVLVSDPWHMFRSKRMALDSGIQAWTSPTHTGPAVQTRKVEAEYIVRETAATIYYRLTKAPADDIGIGIG